MTIQEEIAAWDQRRDSLTLADFPQNLQWLNTAPLSLHGHLNGKLVLLDFWTYCCINCLHVLEPLHQLELKYKHKPVAIIGVHSPKFPNEENLSNLKVALLRHHIQHPIISDPEKKLWQTLGVAAWPTFILLGPYGNLLHKCSGESSLKELEEVIDAALNYYDPSIFNSLDLQTHLEEDLFPAHKFLKFPSKIAIDSPSQRLFVSSMGHDRIYILNTQGTLIQTIGSEPGFEDGPLLASRFLAPQGVQYYQEKLFIADMGNNAIRQIDLVKQTVDTLFQSPELNSPWDLALKFPLLYIALAGSHQIGCINLETKEFSILSGSRQEAHYNSEDLKLAAWAQPSGLTLSENILFIADSESCTIRAIDLKERRSWTLAGGDEQQPRNLFLFGDSDGIGKDARLQHPMAVVYLKKKNSLVIADTYNHRLKWLDLKTHILKSWVGSGEPGFKDGSSQECCFYEPAGLAVSADERLIYVADTNNHAIRIVDVNSKNVSSLHLTT